VCQRTQVAPLYESVPPKLYGGTERVVSYLTEQQVQQGHRVTLFASGDSTTSAELVSVCKRALRLDPLGADPVTVHMRMLKEVVRRAGSFDVDPLQAKAFYATILAAIVIGAIANVLSISPMRALVWIAVINGIVAVPVMMLLMLMAVNARVIGRFTVSGPVLWLGSLATGVMVAAAIGWAASWFMGAAQ